ncbi:MAG: HAD-IIB family hydrolase [Candidatus Saccharimonadales bacterium]
MKKVLAFDLDGTLAPSKSPVPDVIAELLGNLLTHFHVCVMSGGKFEQFDIQLLSNLKLEPSKLVKLHIMPTCGTKYYLFNSKTSSWVKSYSEDLSTAQKLEIADTLKDVIHKLKLDNLKTYGDQLEDRGSQVSWSALGQDIVDVLGVEGIRLKEEWDPNGSKKEKIRSMLAPLLPEFEVRAGGTTTIDITKKGIDKAYGITKLMEQLNLKKEDILFFGDKLQEGGNDYPVKAMGVDSLEVSSWKDTAFALEAILHVS